MAFFEERLVVYFGDSMYQQYKNSTGLRQFSHLNDLNLNRSNCIMHETERKPNFIEQNWFTVVIYGDTKMLHSFQKGWLRNALASIVKTHSRNVLLGMTGNKNHALQMLEGGRR